jgi:hypothetical protein
MLDHLLEALVVRDEDDPYSEETRLLEPRLVAVRFAGQDAVLTVTVGISPEHETTWEITAECVKAHRVSDSTGKLTLDVKGHLLARLLTARSHTLWLTSAARSPYATVGRLLEAHARVVGGWFPFEDYVDTWEPPAKTLAGGYGHLACGPALVLRRYAKVLDAEGVRYSLQPPLPSGRRIAPPDRPPATLLIGRTYFVAEAFVERRVEVSS